MTLPTNNEIADAIELAVAKLRKGAQFTCIELDKLYDAGKFSTDVFLAAEDAVRESIEGEYTFGTWYRDKHFLREPSPEEVRRERIKHMTALVADLRSKPWM